MSLYQLLRFWNMNVYAEVGLSVCIQLRVYNIYRIHWNLPANYVIVRLEVRQYNTQYCIFATSWLLTLTLDNA